jgi:hypothetical protein
VGERHVTLRTPAGRVSSLASGAALVLVLLAGPAGAASVVEPSTNPVVVPATASGDPLPFTIRANGFPAGTNVFVEQCDGTPATAVGWDPTLDCDLGSSPASASVDPNGVANFDASDTNHAFHPFVGVSPQGLFNCLSPTAPSPDNGLADSRDCQVRVSTNNTVATADQVFVTLQLPTGSGTGAAAGAEAFTDAEDGTTLPGQLPRTGSDEAPLGGVGAALLLAGAVLSATGRNEPAPQGLLASASCGARQRSR